MSWDFLDEKRIDVQVVIDFSIRYQTYSISALFTLPDDFSINASDLLLIDLYLHLRNCTFRILIGIILRYKSSILNYF